MVPGAPVSLYLNIHWVLRGNCLLESSGSFSQFTGAPILCGSDKIDEKVLREGMKTFRQRRSGSDHLSDEMEICVPEE